MQHYLTFKYLKNKTGHISFTKVNKMAEDLFPHSPVCRVTIPTLPVVFVFAKEINLSKTDFEDSTTLSRT